MTRDYYMWCVNMYLLILGFSPLSYFQGPQLHANTLRNDSDLQIPSSTHLRFHLNKCKSSDVYKNILESRGHILNSMELDLNNLPTLQ